MTNPDKPMADVRIIIDTRYGEPIEPTEYYRGDKVQALVAALEFYAHPDHWIFDAFSNAPTDQGYQGDMVGKDYGEKARSALTEFQANSGDE